MLNFVCGVFVGIFFGLILHNEEIIKMNIEQNKNKD